MGYSVKVEQLKKFRRAPSSPAQAKLLKNFIKVRRSIPLLTIHRKPLLYLLDN